jgi:transcriptional regulator GlxA family with amidase domain
MSEVGNKSRAVHDGPTCPTAERPDGLKVTVWARALSGHIAALSLDPRLARAWSMVEDHAGHAGPLLDEAAAAGLSANQLNRLFRKRTGLTFRRMEALSQVLEAARLLATTELTVLEVALQVGFGSVDALRYNFREILGLTPITFRKSLPRSCDGDFCRDTTERIG